eukprot:1159132-Pelagomonas_calceolata.AAC.10
MKNGLGTFLWGLPTATCTISLDSSWRGIGPCRDSAVAQHACMNQLVLSTLPRWQEVPHAHNHLDPPHHTFTYT